MRQEPADCGEHRDGSMFCVLCLGAGASARASARARARGRDWG